MLKVFIILAILGCFTGCSNLQSYNDFKSFPDNHELRRYNGITSIDSSILSTFFTPAACIAIQNIPVLNGIMVKPFVTGVNVWSDLVGIISFNGYGRKVIISKEYLKKDDHTSFIHEYIHHLDDMDRDGLGNWIDHREFALAFHRLLQDTSFYKTTIKNLILSKNFITDVFGIGPMSELIAYVGCWIADDNGPDYMKWVYRKILKNCINVQKP